MKVYTVTVFESGDFSTSVWGVYQNLDEAEKYKEELLAGELNQDGYWLNVSIAEHEVIN